MACTRPLTLSFLRRLSFTPSIRSIVSVQTSLSNKINYQPFLSKHTSRHYASSSSSSPSSDSGSSNSDSSGSDSEEEFSSVDDIKLAVLDAALLHVVEYGWTDEAISAGAQSLGYSAMSHGLAEGGGAELFLHFQKRCNEELEQTLKKKMEERDTPSSPVWSVAVEDALKRRLQMITPYLSVWPQGLATMAMSPSLACKGLTELTAMADHVCYFAGDRSTDFTWYTQRASVVGLYKATELCLLQDHSLEFEDTWQFLRRRVTQLDSAGGYLNNIDTVVADTANVARAAALTGLNILGFNEASRR